MLHIQESRELLRFAGAQGFPTFLYEKDGEPQLLESAGHLGQPEAWKQSLAELA
jgi:protein-disulfide isomerase-like protein with CxxC motif